MRLLVADLATHLGPRLVHQIPGLILGLTGHVRYLALSRILYAGGGTGSGVFDIGRLALGGVYGRASLGPKRNLAAALGSGVFHLGLGEGAGRRHGLTEARIRLLDARVHWPARRIGVIRHDISPIGSIVVGLGYPGDLQSKHLLEKGE